VVKRRRPPDPAAPPGWVWDVAIALLSFVVGILVAVLISMAVPAR
jgi:hypothetical protein